MTTKAVFNILELSTAHVTGYVANLFDNPTLLPQGAKRPNCIGEYGWLFIVPEIGDMESTRLVGSRAFITCITLAQEKECAYIVFDNAIEYNDKLEVFDW